MANKQKTALIIGATTAMVFLFLIIGFLIFMPPSTGTQTAENTSAAAACDYDNLIGMTDNQAASSLEAEGKIVRIVRPGQPMTMDFRDNRVNLEIDDNDIVARVFCG